MLRKFWQRITSTHVTRQRESFAHMERAMKEEIARLRAENRALLNSILGIAGIPPIVISEAEATTEAAMLKYISPSSASDPASSSTSFASSTSSISSSSPPRPDKPESPAPKRVRFKPDLRAPRPSGTPHNPAAPRRRSWQQINRMLELASARKPSPET
jgi:hypothetical protein